METFNTNENELCFYLHEYVKEDLLNHVRSVRWRTINDKDYIAQLKTLPQLPKFIRINKELKYEIDITNCWFNQLPKSFQKNYLEIADILEKINSDKEKPLGKRNTAKQQAIIIHKNWILNNSECFWENKIDLKQPFEKLTERAQYFFKITSSINTRINNGINKVCIAQNIHELINEIELNSKRQVNAMLEFNGHKFYSKLDNEQTIYYKLTGLTKDEYEEQLKIARQKAYSHFCLIKNDAMAQDMAVLLQSSKSDYEIVQFLHTYNIPISTVPELEFYVNLIELTYDNTPQNRRVENFKTIGAKGTLFEESLNKNEELKKTVLSTIEKQKQYSGMLQ